MSNVVRLDDYRFGSNDSVQATANTNNTESVLSKRKLISHILDEDNKTSDPLPTCYTIKSFADSRLGNYHTKDGELCAEYCPFCHGGDNDDKNTFYMSMTTGAFICQRGKCGKHGSFKTLVDLLGDESVHAEYIMPTTHATPIIEKEREYVKPDASELRPITDAIEQYFANRGITLQTLQDWKVASDNHGNIVFPFYEGGELVYEKIRPVNRGEGENKLPKEWAFAGGKPILFGMDNVSFSKPLVITEGMVDALSLYEAGIPNVVSVPCGCKDMTWVNLCWNWLEKFNQFILFGDADQPGQEMVQQLMKRFGEDRCMLPPKYPYVTIDGQVHTMKDPNEILYYCGRDALKQLFDACEPAPIDGILNLSDIQYIDPMSIPRVPTRIPTLDKMIGGFVEGGLTVISGKRGEGKSTISGSFLLNAIDDGKSVAAYSGELSASNFLNWIMCQACDRELMTYSEDNRNGKTYAKVPYEIQQRIREWLKDKFYLYDNTMITEGATIDALLKRFSMCARRYGCSIFLVDNLMMLTSGIEEELKAQAKITAALKQFAVRYKAHVILVAHPRKVAANQAFGNDDVAGSAAITNLADVVMSIEKPNIRVTKNREFGDTDLIQCCFDPATRKIYELDNGVPMITKPYQWDHTGMKKPAICVSDNKYFDFSYGKGEEQPF